MFSFPICLLICLDNNTKPKWAISCSDLSVLCISCALVKSTHTHNNSIQQMAIMMCYFRLDVQNYRLQMSYTVSHLPKQGRKSETGADPGYVKRGGRDPNEGAGWLI